MWRRQTRRVRGSLSRVRHAGRALVGALRRWLERTDNLIHLTIVIVVPLLIGAVTALSANTRLLSFLLYPPLASGTYTLFANPEGPYSSPVRFVAGLTLGALCGWLALEVSARLIYHAPPSQLTIHAGAAALGVFFTAVMSWVLDLEEPAAFSTALLVLATDASKPAYVVTVAISSAVVAVVFVVWRDRFYEERARYLYKTTGVDDRVLVPMRGETAGLTAMFAARLAAVHEAGKVVLFHMVDDSEVARAERELLAGEREEAGERATADGEGGGDPVEIAHSVEDEGDRGETRTPDDAAVAEATERAVADLQRHVQRIETKVGVPCEVVVAASDVETARTAVEAAHEAGCDLVVTPYEESDGRPAPFVRDLFRSEMDVVAFRSTSDRTSWRQVLVPVKRAGDVAHAMVDYAQRLVGATGTVSICHCIDREDQRRGAESMLATLAETVSARCETRVSRSTVERFLERNDEHYDLVFLGASTDRSATSRLLSPPTFERVDELDTDVAVVHTGY